MTASKVFGELRSLFHESAGTDQASSWARLCHWLESTSPEHVLTHSDYIAHHLSEWDDATRRAPASWLEQVASGQERPWMSWARTCSLSGRKRRLGQDQISAIRASHFWAGLTRLELWGEPMSAAQFFELIDDTGDFVAPKISVFSGFKVRLGVGFLIRLFESTCCRHVESLTLHRTYLGPGELDAFCNAPLSAGVTSLDLSDCQLGAADLEVISESAFLRPRALRWTDNPTALFGCDLGGQGFERLESLCWGDDEEADVWCLCQALGEAPLTGLTLIDVSAKALRTWGESVCAKGIGTLWLEGELPQEDALLECVGGAGLFPSLTLLDVEQAKGGVSARVYKVAERCGVVIHSCVASVRGA